MTTAWPNVAAKLVMLLRAAGAPAVFLGQPVTAAVPKEYATVGFVEDDDGGSYAVEPIYDGTMLGETGTVACQIVAQGGGTDLAPMAARVFAVADSLQAAIRADPTLGGLLSADATCTASVLVRTVQNTAGSAQSLVVTINYFTRY